MPWVETPSLSFTARHEASQSDDALAVLEDLEEFRGRLEELFPRVPGNVTVILHDAPLQLWFAHPWLSIARRTASRAARRYMAGTYRGKEVHTLSPPALRGLAAGPDSERALLLTPRRAYAALVIGTNNPLLPPPARPAAVGFALRNSWLIEGAAQHLAGQVPLLRAAIATRLREGGVQFPPGRRDAALIGGTVFDLLERERDVRACVRLATHPAANVDAALEAAFGRPLGEIADLWRRHLDRLATPLPAPAAVV